MMKILAPLTFLLSVSLARGWVQHSNNAFVVVPRATTPSVTMAGGDDSTPATKQQETDDPCWQNLLDDDCSMGNIYAANFVAGKWIKSMPCGEGIEASHLNCSSNGIVCVETC
jgi:hypothetical protein